MDNTATHHTAAMPQLCINRDEGIEKSAFRTRNAAQLARREIVRALIECEGEIDYAAKKTGLTTENFVAQMRHHQLPRPIMYRPGFGNLGNIPSTANDHSLLVGSI